jgi:hypothetical protein
MDVTIGAALIGAVGSIIATILGGVIAQRRAAELPPRTRPPLQPFQSSHDPHGDARYKEDPPAQRPRVGVVPLSLLAVGSFLAFTGVALVGYVILSFIVTIFTAIQSNVVGPPDLSHIPFVPFLPLGFGLAFGGIVIVWFGMFVASLSLARSRRP